MARRRLHPPASHFVLIGLLAGPTVAIAQPVAEGRPAPYGSTLTFGTGLVSIPVAWVSPGNGDLFVTLSARNVGAPLNPPKGGGSSIDATQSIEAHFGQRFSVGAALYSTEHQQMGAFGQILLFEQPRSSPRWLPALAIGVRNVGSSKYQDRFVTGNRRVVDVLADSGKRTNRGTFNGSPTAYAVATRDFQFSSNSVSMTVGYGNGLFKETGNLDTIYNKRGTLAAGLFLGARLAMPWQANKLVSLMVENDGFDWNAGVQLAVGNLSFGAYASELEEGVTPPPNKPLAGFTKGAFKISYNASLPGIIDGSTQRAEAAEAQLALRRLEQEVEQRRLITARLVAQLNKVANAADKASAGSRDLLVKQLEAERAALKAAADRLEQLQKKPPEGGR